MGEVVQKIGERRECEVVVRDVFHKKLHRVQPESGDLLVAYLAELGVDFVFGLPGGAIEPLYNALARSERRGGPKPITARHEAGAAFMADGYARNSGKLGVCCATTGPGATNLITGVASAYENSIPMLVITAQTALNNFGRKAFQESTDTGVNTVGMFQFCTGYNTMISHVDQFENKLVTAMMTAIGKSCPAHLSIPLDIFRSHVPSATPSYDIAALTRPAHLQDDITVDELCRQLTSAKKIVFVLGGASSEAASLILRAAFKLHAKIVTTPDGKGTVSPYHPLFCGVIGFAGHRAAEETLADPSVDTVVAIGTDFGEWCSNGWDTDTLLNNRLIHIEPRESSLTRSPMARLHVRGSVVSIFETVNAQLDGFKDKARVAVVGSQSEAPDGVASEPAECTAVHFEFDKDGDGAWEGELVKPQWLMSHLTRHFPPSTKFLADTGNSLAWAIHYLHPFDRRVLERRHSVRSEYANTRTEPRRRAGAAGLFQATLEFASMGWAIGASVGAAMACPRQPIVCITGDGSMLLSGQEITVALEHQLSIVFIVLNDSALGMVKHGQRLSGAEQVGFSLPTVDFSAMAAAMGVRSYRISNPRDLRGLNIKEFCQGVGPTLLDVLIDPEQVPPIGVRVKTLKD